MTAIDGEEDDRELVREEVVTESTDRIVLVGTKAPPATAPLSNGVWERLACESGGDWSAVSANGQ